MRQFFYPASVAVVGVSARPGNLAKNIVRNLEAFGFAGPIYQVSPRGGEWHGRKVYRSLEELPQTPELAVILTPAATVPEIVRACGRRGVRRLIVESGGFRELGEERDSLAAELEQAAREYDIRFIGPNCIGVVCTESGLAVPFPLIPKVPPRGGVSIVSQSGGVGLTYLHALGLERVGLAKFVSVGNKQNVDENDLLAYLAQDPQTEVILLYLESIPQGRRLYELIRACPKPVVVHKANIAPASNAIARSHTAALANDDQVVEAALAQAGAVRVRGVSECIQVVKGLTLPPMRGRRLAVISRSGGHAVVAADAVHRSGLTLAEFPSHYTQAIARHTRASVIRLQNPLDLGDLFDFEVYIQALAGALDMEQVDGVLFVHGARGPEAPASRRFVIEAGRLCRRKNKPVALVLLMDPEDLEALAPELEIPMFPAPEEGITALAALARAGEAAELRRDPEQPEPPPEIDLERAARLLDAAGPDGGLELPEALHLAAAAGVPVAEFVVALEPKEAAQAARYLGGRVVLKAVVPGGGHKTEAGGVILNLRRPEAVERAAEMLLTRLECSRLVVMRQREGSAELIVGAKQDPSFGAVVLVGLGGVAAEALGDVSLRLAPLSAAEAAVMLEELRGRDLLTGFRGRPPVDRLALVDLLRRVAALAAGLPRLAELDLNPVLAGPTGAVCVDARAVVTPA